MIIIGKEYIFDTYGGDSDLNKYSGNKVMVNRMLIDEVECDVSDVGNMYEIKFPDGYITDAFEDELNDIT